MISDCKIMSAVNRLKEFIVDYLRIQSVRTPDLNFLRELCKDTAPQHIYTIIKECTRHSIRHELKDTPESLLKDYETDHSTCLHVAAKDKNFEMVSILFDKLNDEEKMQLLKVQTTNFRTSKVLFLFMCYGGVAWAMELAKSATHEALKTEIYRTVLGYTCQYDDTQALQLLLSTVTSDKLMSLLSTVEIGGKRRSCIQSAAWHGNSPFISIILLHFPSDSVLPLLLEQCEGDGGRTALHIACEGNELSVVKTVIDQVPIENRFRLIIATDDGGNTVLHAAVASGNKKFVLALKMDQLTGEQQYVVMVKENKDRLRAIDLAKEQKNKLLESFLDDFLQESSIRKCNK